MVDSRWRACSTAPSGFIAVGIRGLFEGLVFGVLAAAPSPAMRGIDPATGTDAGAVDARTTRIVGNSAAASASPTDLRVRALANLS